MEPPPSCSGKPSALSTGEYVIPPWNAMENQSQGKVFMPLCLENYERGERIEWIDFPEKVCETENEQKDSIIIPPMFATPYDISSREFVRIKAAEIASKPIYKKILDFCHEIGFRLTNVGDRIYRQWLGEGEDNLVVFAAAALVYERMRQRILDTVDYHGLKDLKCNYSIMFGGCYLYRELAERNIRLRFLHSQNVFTALMANISSEEYFDLADMNHVATKIQRKVCKFHRQCLLVKPKDWYLRRTNPSFIPEPATKRKSWEETGPTLKMRKITLVSPDNPAPSQFAPIQNMKLEMNTTSSPSDFLPVQEMDPIVAYRLSVEDRMVDFMRSMMVADFFE